MKILIVMAARNILRNTRRNLFTILSIACGLAFLFWIQCILNGHEKNMIETITSTFTGDLQIHRNGYIEERQTHMAFDPSSNLRKGLDDHGLLWSERVYFPSLISSGAISYPFVLVGINPDKEGKITTLDKDLKDGELLSQNTTCEKPEILISKKMAHKLEVGLDDKLVILGQDATGSLGNDLYRVKGIFSTASQDFDKSYAFTNIACAQNIAAIAGLHEIVIKTGYHTSEDTASLSILNSLLEPDQSSSTWKNLVPGVANMIKFNNAMSRFITFVLFSVITLGVVNSMLMNIFERVREIGIMLAIGTTPTQVRQIILLESFFMSLIGTILGTLMGLLVVLYYKKIGFDLSPFLGNEGDSSVGFTFQTRVFPLIEWSKYIWLVAIEIIFIVLAGVYPAVKASHLKPIETIRG